MSYVFWNWWRHHATPTLNGFTVLVVLVDPGTLYHSAKLPLGQVYSSWDMDIYVLKLMTSSGYANFHPGHDDKLSRLGIFIHWKASNGLLCAVVPLSNCSLTPRPLSMASQYLVFWQNLTLYTTVSSCNSTACRHTHFEIDDGIRPRPVLVMSQYLIFW